MTIPASKVKSLCTSVEAALVRSSRKPELEHLSTAEVKRLAQRARKYFDKWQGLSRGQSRDRRRQTESKAVGSNTQLKSQIFREALDRFENQLAKRGPTGARAIAPKTRVSVAKPIKTRPRAKSVWPATGSRNAVATGIRKRRTATEIAIQSRFAQSGKARISGHIAARGKRAQGRRDRKS